MSRPKGYVAWQISNIASLIAHDDLTIPKNLFPSEILRFTGRQLYLIPIVSSNFSRHVDSTATQREYSELETTIGISRISDSF